MRLVGFFYHSEVTENLGIFSCNFIDNFNRNHLNFYVKQCRHEIHCWLYNSKTSIQTLLFFCKSSKTESLLFCSDCFCIAFLTKTCTLVNKICPLMPNFEKHMQEMQAIEHCGWVIQHFRQPSPLLLPSPFHDSVDTQESQASSYKMCSTGYSKNNAHSLETEFSRE